jgi:hypothetical protein
MGLGCLAHGKVNLHASQTDRIVMLVDLDYFYAQLEELRNPALKGKPILGGHV